jgi:hypothetical protein
MVVCESGQIFEFGNVVIDIGKLESKAFQVSASSGCALGIQELFFEGIKELLPYDWVVIGNGVKSVNVLSPVADPSSYFRSFHEG